MAKKEDEQQKKTRRGRAVKAKPGEPAELKEGAAAAPRFDPEELLKDVPVYWEGEGGDTFWVQDEHGWAKWPKDAFLDLCQEKYFVSRKKRDGEFMAQSARLLLWIRTHRRVDGVMWGLAGYRSGLATMPSGERVIIRNSPAPVVPAPGDWSLIRELIEGRLDLRRDGERVDVLTDQVIYFHAWHRVVLSSLLYGKPGSWTQRPLLVLAGPHGCGKSRIQVNITNGLLGGRCANPKAFLTGKENFNANMVKAEHMMMEELDNVSQKTIDRLAFSESVKAMVANTGVTLRLMRTDPMTITPFWAVTLSMNNDPDKLRSFPPLTPDFADKVIMLLVRRDTFPLPTTTDAEKEAFNSAIAAQLPAYAHFLLNEFVIPPELLVDAEGNDATRFGCRSWQHPTLAMELYDDMPSAELLAIIDAGQFGPTNAKLWQLASESKHLGEYWEGSSIDLEKLLLGVDLTSSVAREAKRIFQHHKLERLLSRLREDRPLRVDYHRTARARFWRIGPPTS